MLTFAVRLIVEDNGKILCLRQTKKNGGGYSLIGGNVEEHEFAREALAREALEEAGIRVEPADLALVHVLHRHKLKKGETLLVLYFKASRFRGEPASLEPKKFEDVVWLPLFEPPARCVEAYAPRLAVHPAKYDLLRVSNSEKGVGLLGATGDTVGGVRALSVLRELITNNLIDPEVIESHR